MVKTKEILNGKYELTEYGNVYEYIRDVSGAILDKVEVKSCLVNGYKCFRLDANSGKKTYYAHLLVAENFLEKGENATRVTFKDNDRDNICLDNLEWISQTDLLKKVHRNNKNQYMHVKKICKYCDDYTTNSDYVCFRCKTAMAKEKAEQDKLQELREVFGTLDCTKLTQSECRAVKLRADGWTLQQIGSELGISRQRADMLLRCARQKNGLYVEYTKHDAKQFKALQTRLKRIGYQLEEKENSVNILKNDILANDVVIQNLKVLRQESIKVSSVVLQQLNAAEARKKKLELRVEKLNGEIAELQNKKQICLEKIGMYKNQSFSMCG